MTLPPLNTPIAHDGSPECPVHPDNTIQVNGWAGSNLAGLFAWKGVTTYTIIARAPADRIAELEAENAALRLGIEELAQAFEGRGEDSDAVNHALGQPMCCSGASNDCGCMGTSVGSYLAWITREVLDNQKLRARAALKGADNDRAE